MPDLESIKMATLTTTTMVTYGQADTMTQYGQQGNLIYLLPEHERFEERIALDALVNHFWSTLLVKAPRSVAIVIPPTMGCTLASVRLLFRLDRLRLEPRIPMQAFFSISEAREWLTTRLLKEPLK